MSDKILTVNLPEVNIYPNNRFGDIARKLGLKTARNWRKVREGTTKGINDFISSPLALFVQMMLPLPLGLEGIDKGVKLIRKWTPPKFIKKFSKKEVVKPLTLEDVSKWSDLDWDMHYNLAIKDNNEDLILQIRDLHFMSKVPNNNISIRDGRPTTWYHGSRYAGHTTFNSSVSNLTIGGESAIGKEKGNFLTTDLNAAKNYATSPSAKSEFPAYTQPKTIKEKLLSKVGMYTPKYIHPVKRIPEGLGIDVLNMHNNEVSPILLMGMSKSGLPKIYQSNKVYPLYVNPGKTYSVDFKGNPWSLSPVEFPSKYYVRETYPDVDLTPTEIYPNGHFIENTKISELQSNLDKFKQTLDDMNLSGESIEYDGFGNPSIINRYRSWDNKLTPQNFISSYPNYKDRPGYSYSIFELKYPTTTNGAVQYGASEGFNSIHMKDVIDANTGHYENYPIEEIVTLKSNLSKLANPITYDNLGKVIPISKRDNFSNPDIRYGLIPLLGSLLYNLTRSTKNKNTQSSD